MLLVFWHRRAASSRPNNRRCTSPPVTVLMLLASFCGRTCQSFCHSTVTGAPIGGLTTSSSSLLFHRLILGRRTFCRLRGPFRMATSSSTENSTGAMATMTTPTIRARRVTARDLDHCGERLRRGGLVAFPTETVYGLGCHALDEMACRKVFAAKERPLTDPLIVHVTEAAQAYPLWRATSACASNEQSSSLQARVLTVLCDAFWPGPLTLVAVASDAVPSVVMAGTGFVAARSPSHRLARNLLTVAQVPVAAPSANKFGHVSPTTAQHVWDDLCTEDVWILEENESLNNNTPSAAHDSAPCRVGVESSVVKLEMKGNNEQKGTLTVLRQGAVSVEDLRGALRDARLDEHITVASQANRQVTEATATVAPGQTIRHYAPHVPSFLLSADCVKAMTSSPLEADEKISNLWQSIVILDYGQQCKVLRDMVLAYRDLSPARDSAQAAQWVYESLRWAEQVPGAEYILFSPLLDMTVPGSDNPSSDALLLAVQDRLRRAASGVVLDELMKLGPNAPI